MSEDVDAQGAEELVEEDDQDVSLNAGDDDGVFDEEVVEWSDE